MYMRTALSFVCLAILVLISIDTVVAGCPLRHHGQGQWGYCFQEEATSTTSSAWTLTRHPATARPLCSSAQSQGLLTPSMAVDILSNRIVYPTSFATCELFVPSGAQVRVNGQLTRQVGEHRLYLLRCPSAGAPYSFTIRVRVGRLERYTSIAATAGQKISLRWARAEDDFPFVGHPGKQRPAASPEQMAEALAERIEEMLDEKLDAKIRRQLSERLRLLERDIEELKRRAGGGKPAPKDTKRRIEPE